MFLGPALVLLGVWVVYPTISTIIRSFYDRSGDEFVGLDNYETLFSDETLRTAIRNNFLWLLVVPAFVTAIGLVFAVLLERVRFSTAFKVAVFMPMAISLFAAGVIWRFMYEKDPSQGTINAAIAVVKDAVSPAGVALQRPALDRRAHRRAGRRARARTSRSSPAPSRSSGSRRSARRTCPRTPSRRSSRRRSPGGITGVVWRDFKPGGGTPGEVEDEELGLPGVTVELREQSGGAVVATTETEADGTFAFEERRARAPTSPRSARTPSRSPSRASRGSGRASSRRRS